MSPVVISLAGELGLFAHGLAKDHALLEQEYVELFAPVVPAGYFSDEHGFLKQQFALGGYIALKGERTLCNFPLILNRL